jgi:hypothetical protein
VTPSSSGKDEPKKEESKGGNNEAEGSESSAFVEKKTEDKHGEIC